MQTNYEQENKVRFPSKYNFSGNYGVECHNSFLFKVNSVGIFFTMLKYLFARFCLSKYLFAQYLKSEWWQAITIQQWKVKPQDGCFPSLPSVTAFNFHLLILMFLFISVSFFSVLFNLHTKFKSEAAGELLAVVIQRTNWPAVLKGSVAEFVPDISLDLSLEYKIKTMQPAASYIWEKTWSSDPEKFLLNIKLKWAWTKFLNSCFQSLVLLGTDIPKLRPEQEALGTAWAVTHLLKAANISEYAVAWTCRVKKIRKIMVYNGIGIFFYVFEWAWSFLYPWKTFYQKKSVWEVLLAFCSI